MANTIKTLTGEILASEVEAVLLDQTIAPQPRVGQVAKVIVIGKTGVKYDVTSGIQLALATKIQAAAINYVAGTGHNVFDPSQVN